MERKSKLKILLWGVGLFLLCQIFTFFLAFYQKLEERFFGVPDVDLSLPIPWWMGLIYFFGATALLSIICWFIPVSKLKIALKIIFILLFVWAIALIFGIFLPFPGPVFLAVLWGGIWFFTPPLWFWNLSMLLALVSIGLIFGPLFSPWGLIILLVIISIYDVLAVRLGFMQWLVKAFAQCEVLPAIIIPKKKISDLCLSFKKSNIGEILNDASVRERFSILGGGDIAFPLLLIVSVFFNQGFINSLIVAIFSLIGLAATYFIFLFFLKEKAMPALPPIVFFSILGFLITHFLI